MHCVCSTKGRLPLIPEPEKLWSTLRSVAIRGSINLLAVGGTSNHVHLLLALPSTRALADVMRELKATSSGRMRYCWPKFAWQDGYGAISVSPTAIAAAARYIHRQKEHHSRHSFEAEYAAILQRAGVKYDPEYLFD